MDPVAPSPTLSATTSSATLKDAAEKRGSCGDAHARFSSVVLPHLDDAYALAHWLTGSRADSEDVVQDACLRALRAIGNFSDGNARAWVLTIVRNTTYSWLQKNRPPAIVMLEDFEGMNRSQSIDLNVETPETPETMLIALDGATLLEGAIATLPAPLRETLVLREVRQFSYREIAEVTGVSIGTVMSRLARARSRVISMMTKGTTSRSKSTPRNRAPAEHLRPRGQVPYESPTV
jgi:RNA polymerase sigma factor (sigma-70 family)